MAEQSVFTSRAVVYVVDPTTRGWAPSAAGNAFTRLDIYVHSGTGAARVIGRAADDPNKISINSNITKETQYTKARDTFHQWSDARGAFGLNFSTAPEADAFAVAFEGAKAGKPAGAPQPPAPAPKPPAPTATAKPPPPQPPAPTTPKGAAPPPPGPPAPPKGGPPPPPKPPAPPKPSASAPPSGDGPPPASGERNALLNSIQGFSKGGLKKTQTVDKSGPLLSNKPAPSGGNSLTRKDAADISGGAAGGGSAAPPPSSGGGGGGGVGDMMAEMMKKRQAMANKAAAGEPAAPKPAVSKPAPPTPAATTTAKPFNSAGKAAPPPPASKAAATPSAPLSSSSSYGSSASAGKELPEHLQILKDQIMAEVRAELAQLKADLLESLQR